MNMPIDANRDLVLTRLIDAAPEAVYRCWTDPALLRQWFAPKPWTTPRADLDVRPGGASNVVMADENGTEYPSPGQYLELVPNRKLVFTDAFTGDWMPSEKPFFTCVLTFEPENGKTRYTAIARHWNAQDREAHEKMGFHEGWGLCAAQMEEVAKRL
ncbi:SRPBCC family protein [Devosia sp. YIM 151766]|uniref:SRPBCC family protein n=1 Tax=Devosia sp. YIM 151766 TaxID=3017325 RepID=UPI00255D07E0|nr:SRPBCC family protein [Devosia sp. YIM 151766]WIY53965.1 SRPBCC family protein [Devosia sp. YIM 151766]